MIRLKRYVLCVAVLSSLASFSQKPIQLGGSWEYAIGDSVQFSDYVMLPGAVKSAEKVWYRRGVYVPQDWQRQRITLYLERLYAEAVVYVNDQRVGNDSLRCAPHEYDVSALVVPGQRNTVTVCVAKTERNGIFGRMELRVGPPDLFIRQVHFEPHPFDGVVHIDLSVGGNALRFEDFFAEIMVQRADIDSADIFQGFYKVAKRHVAFDMPLGNEVALWDEFHPHRYRIAISLGDEYVETTIGMRELMTDSSQLIINRRPLYLRSVVMGNPQLESGSNISDEQAWLDLLKKYKNWGFNHLSFEHYCPTEAAFAMADKVGILLQPVGISNDEQQRVMDAYGHHPSLMMTTLEGIEQIPAEKDFSLSYYKDRIEHNQQVADYRGFQLTDFNRPETELPAKEWTEFCAPIVPLAKFPKYEYSMADTLEVPLEVSSAYYGEVRAARATYFICDDSQKVMKGGQLSVGNLPIRKNIQLGSVIFPLNDLPSPGKYSLYVAITGKFRNHWDFQVLPKEEE